jgi:hypothetical protein
MGEALVVESSTQRGILGAYPEQVLAAVLEPRGVVVSDNLQAHKGERVREVVEEVWYLCRPTH